MSLELLPALAPGVRKSEVLGWAMYDFANSAYTTVVITAVYNAYFVATVCAGADWGTLAWTAALSVSYLLIMLTAPALGAYADQRAVKKPVLIVLTIGCVLTTAGLAATGAGDLWLALTLIVLSNWFYGSGENIAAAFLPELATSKGMGRISGFSWSLGYLGGLLALGVCLWQISAAQSAGQAATHFVPVSMLVTAGFFAGGALLTFVLLRERAVAGSRESFGVLLRGSLRQTWRSLRQLQRWPELRRFLYCIVAYQAGIQVVIALAAIYATQALGFSITQTIQMIVIVNLTAAVGAALFGLLQDRIGHRRSLLLALAGWVLTIALLVVGDSQAMFWVAANLAGLNLGAAQSAGRALVGYMAPVAHSGEFFGLWGLAVKAASVIGPLTYGLLSFVSGGNHRVAMLATGLFFIVGMLLLLRVDVSAGHQRAGFNDAA
jgi:UMF1 family MFS transporter